MMMDEGAKEPAVVRVFPELPSVPVPLWVVCHRELGRVDGSFGV